MQLQQILSCLESLAALHLAASWDVVGLAVGDDAQSVERGLLCIDLTEAVVDEALAAGAGLIIAYHPPLFRPLKQLTARDAHSRSILKAARAGIAIYSPHTALDAAAGGVNDWLAQVVAGGSIEGADVRSLDDGDDASEGISKLYKLVTFVPAGHLDAVRKALSDAGAGRIGRYVDCAFTTRGEGSFRGLEGADPFIGQAGRLETVEELRLEMQCPRANLGAAVAALRQSHPYEEPAFDLYPLASPPSDLGPGRLVNLPDPINVADLVARIKAGLNLPTLKVAMPRDWDASTTIQRIALCAGAGGSIISRVPAAQVLFTGEMRHHEVLAAVARGRAVVLAGHTNTERPYLPRYLERIQSTDAAAVSWTISQADRTAMQWW